MAISSRTVLPRQWSSKPMLYVHVVSIVHGCVKHDVKPFDRDAPSQIHLHKSMTMLTKRHSKGNTFKLRTGISTTIYNRLV